MGPQVSTYHPLENRGENSDSSTDSPYISARILQKQRPPALSQTQRKHGVLASHAARAANAQAAEAEEKRRRQLIGKRHALLRGSPWWNERALENARRELAERAGITLLSPVCRPRALAILAFLAKRLVLALDENAWLMKGESVAFPAEDLAVGEPIAARRDEMVRLPGAPTGAATIGPD